MNEVESKWNRNYRKKEHLEFPAPAYVLEQFAYLLPDAGEALDLACGRGANACFLASRGLKTTAWDISSVAVAQINRIKRERCLNLNAEVQDVGSVSFPPDRFDVIVVSRFLDRGICASIVSALKPGGLLYYQTFVRGKDPRIGPSNPDYLLADDELLSMFSALKHRVYNNISNLGDLSKGLRNEACYIGQKPLN